MDATFWISVGCFAILAVIVAVMTAIEGREERRRERDDLARLKAENDARLAMLVQRVKDRADELREARDGKSA